jgi:copper chaperone
MSTTERVSLTIEGMSCGHCVRGVDQALRSLPGVEVEKVDVGSAVIAYDPALVQPQQIEQAIAEEGYEIRSMARA